MARDAGLKAGTYSLVSTGAAAGTFAQTTAGALPTEEWIPTTAFNVDVMDGDSTPDFPVADNPSGFELDVTDLGVYKLQLQYLGNGDLFFRFENPINGQFSAAHTITRAGEFSATSFGNMALPGAIYADNGATTSNITVATSSMSISTEGNRVVNGPAGVVRSRKTGIGATETCLFVIANPIVYRGQPNHFPIVITEIALSTSGGNSTSDWRIVRNPVLGSGATALASFVGQNDAPVLADKTFSTGATGGEEILGPYQSASTTTIRTFNTNTTDAGRVYPGETMAVLVSTQGSNIVAGAAASWRWDV
jgi:hypothetical protein